MRLLLDAHVLLWWAGADKQLGAVAGQAIRDPGNEVFLSAATVWELSIKFAAGRLDMPEGLIPQTLAAGVERLSIDIEHAIEAAGLPRHHADPFDRMVVAQARRESMTLVTADRVLARYEVPLLSARH